MSSWKSAGVALGRPVYLGGVASVAFLLAGVVPQMPFAGLPAGHALAQEQEQMLLEADTLIYDQDAGTVTAAGNVRIDYLGNRVVADRVIYNQRSRRLIAVGRVEILDSGNNRIFGDEIDISDTFRDGFINALQIETADKTYFAAESGERSDGNITTLNNGIYTACEPCEEKPDRPPIWRIKAARIIWNGKEKIVRFERSRMEIFGLPIAYFPVLELPDHTVKRKSGLLFPTLRLGPSELGFGVSVPYYWALSPTYDLTTTLSAMYRQGFMPDLEWRQRFNSGDYSIRAAGIYQLQPDLFPVDTHDRANRFRGMIGTTGRFQINPRWTFGWKLLGQTDENFSYTYGIPGYSDHEYTQNIYLTGLNDRNFFDLQLRQYKIQEATTLTGTSGELPFVLPILDYSYTIDRAVAGGELSFDVNAQHLRRERLVTRPTAIIDGDNFPGPQGAHGRMTAQAEWRSSLVVPGGLVLTPMLHARGDAIFTDLSPEMQAAIASTTIDGTAVPSDLRPRYFRGMVTAGLEARWPILFTGRRTTHVVEPVAQIFARPNAPFDDVLGIPNEDAQSMVFDTANLFSRDKFSGYDEMEGGVRANVGLRYTGTFGTGWVLSAIAGQSYHLAGYNSYGSPSLVNAGAYSGLETARSDYVASAMLAGPSGRQFAVGGRLDETTLEVRRVDVRASGSFGPVMANVGYAFIQAQPLYGFAIDRHQVSLSASGKVGEFWRGFGSISYDLQSRNLVSTSIGISYDDECFGFAVTATQAWGANNTVTSQSIGLNISFRTIGDFGQTSTLSGT